MPSLKIKYVLKNSLERRLDILNHFDKTCEVHALHRKWIPDVVFAGVMNKLFHSNVDAKELNKTLNYCRGLQMDDPSNKIGKFRGCMNMYDPTSTNPIPLYRNIYFYYICNQNEKPNIEFGHW